MVLGQILQLHDAPGKPPGTVGPVELEHPVATVIVAGGVLHGGVFLHTALRQLEPE